MCVLAHWYEYVMNVIMGLSKVVVSFAEELGFLMLTIVKSVRNRRRIEMVVQKLLILEVPKQISSMSVKNMGLRRDEGDVDSGIPSFVVL